MLLLLKLMGMWKFQQNSEFDKYEYLFKFRNLEVESLNDISTSYQKKFKLSGK
jgi:hypothetical protein